jgi:isopentenyl diphosphate isomerase/L-lactate dehydrogenase-like FMN-dependent dehydrogenase
MRLLEGELRRAMSLLGTRAIGELDASYVRRRGTW